MTSNFTLVDGLGLELRIFNPPKEVRGQRQKLTLEVTSKTSQNDFKLHICEWFGVRIENIQSDPPKDVRGKS